MQRLIDQEIKTPMAKELLFGKLIHGGEVAVRIKDDQPAFEVTPAPPKAAKPKSPKKSAAKKSSKAR
jgi:ATP-dependent Clp protease ATP-binding subunit ClpA